MGESIRRRYGGIHSQLAKFEGGWLFPKRGMTGAQIIEKFGQDKIIDGLRRFYQQADWKFLIDDFEKAVEFTAKKKKKG